MFRWFKSATPEERIQRTVERTIDRLNWYLKTRAIDQLECIEEVEALHSWAATEYQKLEKSDA
jgi:hypothetical protein